MDSLPVELLRLILTFCSPPTVRALRLVTPTLATLGYDYLLPPHFTSLPWRPDIARLHAIASHDSLCSSIHSLTINLSEVDEYSARHASFFTHYLQDPEERTAALADAWAHFGELDRVRKEKGLPVPLEGQSVGLRDALGRLGNLRSVSVQFGEWPLREDVSLVRRVFESVPGCRRLERPKSIKAINAIVAAVQGAGMADSSQANPGVTSFAIDRLPLELFRSPSDRRHWFSCADVFTRLTTLDLALDTSDLAFPASKFKAINGLGRVLRSCVALTKLGLAFHNYTRPRDKFLLWLGELLGGAGPCIHGDAGSDSGRSGANSGSSSPDRSTASAGFVFPQLTDLKIEGVCCDEDDLREFLLRHAGTLERLRLGGRGLAIPRRRHATSDGDHEHDSTDEDEGGSEPESDSGFDLPYSPSGGGLDLCRGTFRSLFYSLRGGRLTRLKRLHLEGDFECESLDPALREVYIFHAVSDEEWNEIGGTKRLRAGRNGMMSVDGSAFERLLLEGGDYPTFPTDE